MDIQKALAEFITFGAYRDDAIGIMVATSVSNDSEQYTLTTPILVNVLTRCINGEIDIDDLELWANVIESRSDIDNSAHEGVIYALSNSEQMGTLSYEKLTRLLKLLQQ